MNFAASHVDHLVGAGEQAKHLDGIISVGHRHG